ncbi:MAG: IS5 family transposase [Burkholderiales bacterium]
MRGHVDPQSSMFTYFSPESRVPSDHPLRLIKKHADAVLRSLGEEFDRLYAATGRPSIPPERLLKSSLLIALYSVRSDRMFCEMLDDNILFRWFLDMSLDERGIDQSAFSRLRRRLCGEDTARRFFDAVVSQARRQGLLSDDNFTVDGTLIEAWASLAKSVQPKDGPLPPEGGGRDDQGMVDFHGQKRSDDTHESRTDPDSKMARKGPGKETRLCFGAHALMENRNGLRVDIQVRDALTKEATAAEQMLDRQRRRRVKPKSLGADKGYHHRDFVKSLRERGIAPHIAQIKERRMPGLLDARTTRHASYELSQRSRKRVEGIFGWMKSYGGLRRTMVRGLERVQLHAYLVGAAYNLLRMCRLQMRAG